MYGLITLKDTLLDARAWFISWLNVNKKQV